LSDSLGSGADGVVQECIGIALLGVSLWSGEGAGEGSQECGGGSAAFGEVFGAFDDGFEGVDGGAFGPFGAQLKHSVLEGFVAGDDVLDLW